MTTGRALGEAATGEKAETARDARAERAVQGDAERVLVGASVDAPSCVLLWRDVAGRAEDGSVVREPRLDEDWLRPGWQGAVFRRSALADHAEVANQYASVIGDEDVVGLEIAVHETGKVGGVQTSGG